MKKRSVIWLMTLPAGMLSLAGVSLGADQVDPASVGGDELAWVPGEVIVRFRDVPAPTQFDRVRRRVPGTRAWRQMSHGPRARGTGDRSHPLARVRVVKLQPGRDVQVAAQRISRIPGVAYAHPNYIIRPAFTPNDPRYEIEQYGPQRVNAPQAWDLTTGNENIVIAIADSGLYYIQEDFVGAVWTNEDDLIDGEDNDENGFVDDYRGWDFIHSDNYPVDAHGHGTHVAGIAAARINNGKGIAGMSNCKVMVLQVFYLDGNQLLGTWEAIAEAIYYATDNGAHVLNYSGSGLGSGGSGPTVLTGAVEYAWENDMTVVAAAGNYLNYGPYYPAGYPETIAVAGTTPDDTRWIQSGYVGSAAGPHIDVAAPALNVLSTWRTSRGYMTETGTSMATPHVTGLVALMYSLNPNLHVEEVRTLLHENAVDLGDPGRDYIFGWGRIDAGATLDAVQSSIVGPFIVHDEGISTSPFSGYVDCRAESSDGLAMDLGIENVTITFSDPVRDVGSGEGGELTLAAFTITGTAAAYPEITAIDATGNPTIEISLSGPIPAGEWTTIVADVEDLAGNRIINLGDMGEGIDETDRIDIGFLPGDLDQDRQVALEDLDGFLGMLADTYHNPVGDDLDYADINRDDVIAPKDLIQFRQLMAGTGTATRPWADEALAPRP